MIMFAMGDGQHTVSRGFANDLETDAKLAQHAVGDAIIGDLDDHRRLLAEQHRNKVFLIECLEIEVHTVCSVGKIHLQQSGNQTACRHIMTSQNEVTLNKFLDGVEALLEISDALHIGCRLTDGINGLRETAAAEFEAVFRKVDVKEFGVLVSFHHGTYHLTDVRHLAGS